VVGAQRAGDDAAVAAAWGVGPVRSAVQPETGTVNRTILLTTDCGRFVLRGYRHRERRPVDREHAVIAYVRARGVPAVVPLPLPGGETVLERDGRFFALFPWAPGQQVRRAAVGSEEATAMGAGLGRLHRAIAGFPVAGLPRRPGEDDRRDTLARMDRLEDAIRAAAPADPLAAVALARLAGQRAYLERLPGPDGRRPGPPPAQPAQPIHGDYQESNLFFARGRVSAVIDWDQTALARPAWEVVRALDLVFGFESGRCGRFVAAYRTERALPLADLDAAAAAYDVRTSHGLWVYETLYLAGDRRVARFFEEGNPVPFAPVAERWARARAACAPEAAV
jgi:Ser/Thr protein kinase RdoA (MazF antagonist)